MKFSTREIKIAAIASVITGLLFTSGLLVLLTPFPLYFVSVVYGRTARRLSIILTAAAAIVVYVLILPLILNVAGKWPVAELVFMLPGAGLSDYFTVGSAQYFGLVYLSYFMLFGYIFSEGLEKKWPLVRCFVISVSATFAFALFAALVPSITGVSVISGIEKYMGNILNELVQAQETAGISTGRIIAIQNNAEEIIRFSMTIIPAVLFVMGLAMAVLNQMVARWMIKTPGKFVHLGDIKKFELPHQLIWGVIGFGFLFFLERYVISSGAIRIVTLNALIVLGGIYFFQGLIIASFYLGKIRGRLIKMLAYAGIFMFLQASAPLLIIVGFTDLWIDFRRMFRKKDEKKRRELWK